jgi:serine/threonine protein phosphatase PrpC
MLVFSCFWYFLVSDFFLILIFLLSSQVASCFLSEGGCGRTIPESGFCVTDCCRVADSSGHAGEPKCTLVPVASVLQSAVHSSARSLVLDAAAVSHVGLVRRTNQDAWSYSADAGVFAVCDGMGGAAGGDVASHLAAEAFLESVRVTPEEQRTARSITQAICAANRLVHTRGNTEKSLRGMGTTLVAVVARGRGRLAVAHVGDSRCYLFRGGELARCTEDHSLVAEQLRMGVLTEDAAASAPLGHVITRALGTRRVVEPEVRTLQVDPGDLFLLCSDGLTRELPDAAIAVLLGRPGMTLEARADALVQAALQGGGRDNVTCMLVAVG